MLASCVAILGTADDAYHPGTPELTCVADQVRITATGPRTVTFSPIANDYTNDGATIFLDAVQALDASKGTLTRDGDSLTYEAPEAFAGTFDLAYTAQSTTGATGDGTIAFIIDGDTTVPSCTGVPDTIDIDGSTTTRDYDVLANDTGTGPIEIMPGSLVQPASGPTIAIQAGKIQVTRNGAGTGTYIGSYRPRLVDGSAVGLDTQITIRVVAATVTAADFAVTVAAAAAQPFKIDALARCSGSGPLELTPGGLVQPSGNNDSAVITGSGSSGYIDYTRGTTPVGFYTMKYKVRLVGNTGVEAQGTITINVTAAYWIRPIAGGREWQAGPGYHDRNTTLWTSKVGAIGAWTSQTMSETSRDSWVGTWGGSATQGFDNLTNANGSQTDRNKAVWKMLQAKAPGGAFIVLVAEAIPDGYTLNANDERIYDYLDSNTSDARAGYERWGARIGKNCWELGWRDPDMIWMRLSHEMNQSNTFRVWDRTRARYRYSMERVHTWMRTGFARYYPSSRLRFIHSPGRVANIGPFNDWIPQSAGGGVDALTLSFHPGPQVTNLTTYAKFLDRWDNGSYGILRDLEPAAELLGLPIIQPEWSPNKVYKPERNKLPCPASDIVLQQFTKHLRKTHRAGNLIFDTPFDQDMFNPTAYEGPDAVGQAAWRRMVGDMVDIYMGSPKGTPPSLQVTGGTTVSLTGDSYDFNAIAACTGSGAVRIKRIVSASGGLAAEIAGSEANAKVRIKRNGASNGTKKVIVEMTLASINYLLDLEITVSVSSTPSVLFNNPFNKDSAHHRPIGTGAVYAGEGDASTAAIKAHAGRGTINAALPFGAAFAKIKPSDPVQTVTKSTLCGGSGPGIGLPVTIKIPPSWPPGWTAEFRCLDNTAILYDPETEVTTEFFAFDPSNPSNYRATIARTFDIKGLGHGTVLGQRLGTSASGAIVLMGALRAEEVLAAGMPMLHAHHVAVPRLPGHNTPLLLGRGIQWPATAGDGSAYTDATHNTGMFSYGDLLGIPPESKGGPNFDTLGLSEPGRRLAQSFRDYGVYVVDGGPQIVMRATDSLGGLHTTMRDDFRKLWPLLRRITNAVTGATATINATTHTASGSLGTPSWPAGGGTPLAPNSAFDAS